MKVVFHPGKVCRLYQKREIPEAGVLDYGICLNSNVSLEGTEDPRARTSAGVVFVHSALKHKEVQYVLAENGQSFIEHKGLTRQT